ncbi:MAG: class I tRNA ligase family protein, partial [Stellaceae bacterium]
QTPELKRYYPTDTLVTMFDIIFFWVARMMMMGLHFMGEAPFRTVYIHALVRDEFGHKMSKSKGNIIDPLDLIERYGCDALRFTLTALAAQGRDIKLSESRVEGYRNFATKLWHAARFGEMNECKLTPGYDPNGCKLTLNRWIVGMLAATGARVGAALDEYKFNEAAGALYQFAWGTYCDWYLELSKPILNGADPAAKAETRATTAWVLAQIAHLLHPISPFITEAVWEHLTDGKGGLLISAKWPDYASIARDDAGIAEMEWVVALIASIRTVRSEMNVPAAQEIVAYVRAESALAPERLATHLDAIRRLARLKSLDRAEGAGWEGMARQAVQVTVEGATVFLDLASTIDLGKERQRLEKEAKAVTVELEKIARKLGNEQFLAKAKPEVVEEQRERQAEHEAALARVRGAMARLGAA